MTLTHQRTVHTSPRLDTVLVKTYLHLRHNGNLY